MQISFYGYVEIYKVQVSADQCFLLLIHNATETSQSHHMLTALIPRQVPSIISIFIAQSYEYGRYLWTFEL